MESLVLGKISDKQRKKMWSIHSSRKCKEYTGFWMSNSFINKLCKSIVAGEKVDDHLGPALEGRWFYRFEFKGHSLVAVYDPKLGWVVTVYSQEHYQAFLVKNKALAIRIKY